MLYLAVLFFTYSRIFGFSSLRFLMCQYTHQMDGKITFVNVERKLFILVFDMNTMAVKVCYRNPICMPAGLNGVFWKWNEDWCI